MLGFCQVRSIFLLLLYLIDLATVLKSTKLINELESMSLARGSGCWNRSDRLIVREHNGVDLWKMITALTSTLKLW